MWKVIAIDNFNRDYVADRLIVDNISKDQAELVVTELNKYTSGSSSEYYVFKPQDYKLKEVDY